MGDGMGSGRVSIFFLLALFGVVSEIVLSDPGWSPALVR